MSNKQENATANPQPLLLSTESFFFICVYIATKDELHKSQLEELVILAPLSVSIRKTIRQVMEHGYKSIGFMRTGMEIPSIMDCMME